MTIPYTERCNLACEKGFKLNGNFLLSLKKYHLKLIPGKWNSSMPEEYIMAPIPHYSTPNAWIYSSMIVDKDFE